MVDFELILRSGTRRSNSFEPARFKLGHGDIARRTCDLKIDGNGVRGPEPEPNTAIWTEFCAEWHLVLAFHGIELRLRSIPRTRFESRSTSSANDRACNG